MVESCIPIFHFFLLIFNFFLLFLFSIWGEFSLWLLMRFSAIVEAQWTKTGAAQIIIQVLILRSGRDQNRLPRCCTERSWGNPKALASKKSWPTIPERPINPPMMPNSKSTHQSQTHSPQYQSLSLLPQKSSSSCHSQVHHYVASLGLEEPLFPITFVLLTAPTPPQKIKIKVKIKTLPWAFPTNNRSLSKRELNGRVHVLRHEEKEEKKKCGYQVLKSDFH